MDIRNRKRATPISLIIITCLLLLPQLTGATLFPDTHKPPGTTGKYNLSLSFDLNKHQVIGTVQLHIPKETSLHLRLDSLTMTGGLIQNETGEEFQLEHLKNEFILPKSKKNRTVYLSYHTTLINHPSNLVAPEGISLINDFYPKPYEKMAFSVTATIPDHFTAISESDVFPLKRTGNQVKATFSNPTTQIHFFAGPYTVEKLEVRKGLSVYSLFFNEDASFSKEYLSAASNHIKYYEKLLSPFPYNHFVIVGNRIDTGLGMPTFTALGQRVLRLPFIPTTSLRHEVVHSWFGNSIEVDFSSGNWCEGLTSYLADHAFRKEKGDDGDYRKENIVKYMSLIPSDSTYALKDFTSPSHLQPLAEVKRAVGYTRGALFFHELHEKIGGIAFSQALQLFTQNNMGTTASWKDIQKTFELVSKKDLSQFFTERLQRHDIPQIDIQDTHFYYKDNRQYLEITVAQKTKKPYELAIPVYVKTMQGIKTSVIETNEQTRTVTIPINGRPLEITVDPNYSFLRQLSEEETPAVWSQFLGGDKKLIILPNEKAREIYHPLLQLFSSETKVILAEQVTNKHLSENNLLILGNDNQAMQTIFAKVNHPQKGLTLEVRKNPLNSMHVATILTSDTKQTTTAVARRLFHYGKYSYLEFKNNKNTVRKISPSLSGLHYPVDTLPQSSATRQLNNFEQQLQEISKSRVIYIGESHNSFADHLLQLRIIEKLFAIYPDIAIGMEMFPTSSQAALDDYILAKKSIDEKTFLKNSNYFKVWSYDYRFFRDIIYFAKKNTIPVIGLNVEKRLVSELFRKGHSDDFTQKDLDLLPKERDLGIPGYAAQLAKMYRAHMTGGHAKGLESGFIQAQGLWDETMAKNIASFLLKNPTTKLIILAGSQHTRKDFGIPPRVSRRVDVKQLSLLNLTSTMIPSDITQKADFFFLSESQTLPPSPKIGLILQEKTKENKSFLQIEQLSPHSKAEKAGFKVGDILLTVNDYPVSTLADLKIGLLDKRNGDLVPVKINRIKNGRNQTMILKVELTSSPKRKPHP